jgi:L-alanine-DL-glutamate epimerase-like enolase superfamily enzyme
MRITRITAHTARLDYAGAAYRFSQGRSYGRFQTTVVVIDTDGGIAGLGEACPCGPAYMPAFADGLLPALALLAPPLIGRDPRETTAILRTMDSTMAGHEVAKTLVDLACWDILGKSSGLPAYMLLGGKLMDSIPLHRVVPLGTPEQTLRDIQGLRDRGYRHFQVKLGSGVDADVAYMAAIDAARQPGDLFVGDANGAWRRDEALRISAALRDVDLYLEQPCDEYDACVSVRRNACHAVKLDEGLASVGDVRRAIADDAMDAAALKLSRYAGITRSRIVRDLCVDAGIALTVEEAWGSGIASAAAAHLAISTPPECLLNGTDIHNYNSNQIASGALTVREGRMFVDDRPGLGMEIDLDALGDPIWWFPGMS